jgi:hypothetical protein
MTFKDNGLTELQKKSIAEFTKLLNEAEAENSDDDCVVICSESFIKDHGYSQDFIDTIPDIEV